MRQKNIKNGDLVADGYDEAVIGRGTNGQLIYDIDHMAEIISARDGCDIDEAHEFIMYNVIGNCGMVPASQRPGSESAGYPFKTNGGNGEETGSGPF